MDDDPDRNTVRRILANLSEKEIKVLQDRLGEDMNDNPSLQEVIRQFNFTRSRIREIEEKALRHLRRKDEPPMTKIIVQNYGDQFALSRKQIETIIDVLPNRYFKPIKEILLCSDERNEEPFEYAIERKTVYFSFPVKQKTREDVERAVEAMLVGLARIEAGRTFYCSVRQRERQEYDEFVSLWKVRIMDALFA